MLVLQLDETETFSEETQSFVSVPGQKLKLEHSLVSLSKWESKYQTPFLSKTEKTREQLLDYILMMSISEELEPSALLGLSPEDISTIQNYIDSSQSATTFPETKSRAGIRETITSELIYYWMIAYTVPFECEKWHLNKLISLLRICEIKNSKPKKMSRQELAAKNRALNEQRRKELGTNG